MISEETAEETLDPEDWGSMRKLGHHMLDDMMDYPETLRDRPVWQHPPHHVKSHFETSPPLDPQSPKDVYEEYVQYILPYQLGNCHPRFWGWVLGTGTVMGMFAEMLGAATNATSGNGSYISGNYVEMQVLDWCKTMLGYLLLQAACLLVVVRLQTSSDLQSLAMSKRASTFEAKVCRLCRSN